MKSSRCSRSSEPNRRAAGRRFWPWLALGCAWTFTGATANPSLGLAASIEGVGAAPSADFAGRFGAPPADARILKIIHSWPDGHAQQDALRERLQGQGFGGVVCNVSFDQYLQSPEKWAAFARAVREAKRAGMALWLYDERGYPSGNAGGLVLKNHPEWEARGLLVADTASGPGPVTLKTPPGDLVLASAFPESGRQIDIDRAIDLRDRVRDRQLAWTAPAGAWRVIVVTEDRLYGGTHAAMNLAEKLPYINLLQPEPTARFLELTHARYAANLGEDLGRYFVATFTDEPSLMSLFLQPMPWKVLPWAPILERRFREQSGYELRPGLAALVADAGPRGAQVRHDFWRTVGELVSDNYAGQIQQWCRAHGVLSGGHYLAEEGLASHVGLYGDFFRCMRRLDAPGIDCLTSLPPEVPWFIAKLAAGPAELERRRFVMCETSDHGQQYRPAADSRPRRAVSEAEIRGTCNRLMVAGVNRITSYYSFEGLGDPALRRLNDWVGRCGTALSEGHQAADVALLCPTESLWTHFTPSRHWANEAAGALRIEGLFKAAAEAMFAARRDFTVIDSRALVDAKAGRGVLTHGDLRWRVVVLPGVDTLPAAAWERLAAFVRGGGIVVALGALPANSEREFPSAQVRAWAAEMFGADPRTSPAHALRAGGAGLYLADGSESLLGMVLDNLLEPELRVQDRHAPLRLTRRRAEGHDLFFVVNDSPQPWSGTVAVAARGPGRAWDPATGASRDLAAPASFEIALPAYGATFLRFPSAVTPARRAWRGASLPGLRLTAIPQVEPAAARGEFVREDIQRERVGGSEPAWRARARLTKGEVDTFLFLRFPLPRVSDWSGAESLVLRTSVPVGQGTPSQLLAIVQEEGGGDFIAHTGRSLAADGAATTYVPFSRFQLAGWSRDADGQLDLRRIKEIRIGWGGYLGRQGETIEFSVSMPALAGPGGPGPASQ
jgi:hypothetical protein